jgi:predicted nuclease with RNAse H fold
MDKSQLTHTDVVIGVDVGGQEKGYHAVALRGGRYWNKLRTRDAAEIAAWCRQTGARAVGIDAPCRWSRMGRARAAERALAAERIHAFATPNQTVAEGRPFNHWMLNGAALYRLLERHYRLFDGSNTASGPVCFETFPHAVACALAGKIVSARSKRVIRRQLLREAGIDTTALTNIDTVDAALCALTAQNLLAGNIKIYGEATEGFIVVPG